VLDDEPLDVVAWRTGQDVLDAIVAAAQSLPSRVSEAGSSGLGLHLLMPEYEARMAGAARNIAQERIALVQAVATRRGDG
jgi:hypothetical protein